MTKKNMAISLIFLFLLTLSGCIVIDGTTAPAPQPPPSHEKPAPPDWAPAHGHRAKYNYRYYPSQSIYYDTGRKLYFFKRNGSWTVAVSLPVNIRLHVNDFVTFEMDTDRPYTRHNEIRKKYPPGQKKKPVRVKKKPVPERHVKYNYRYYPSQSIYYDTGRKLYFFERNGSWTVAVSLPVNIRLHVNDFVTFEMDTDRPYTRHNEIRKKYPPGQKKKRDRGKDNKGNKGKYKDNQKDKN